MLNINQLNLMNIETLETEEKLKFIGSNNIEHALWNTAIDDIEKNYCIDTEYGRVFAAGGYNKHKNWNGMTFNRDTAYSGILALNLIKPRGMLINLKAIRECRKKLGFSCIKNMVIHGIDNVVVYDMELEEFKKIFHKASAINKTDDVVWMWCAYDLLMKNNFDEWEWLYNNGKECFERFYDCFFDVQDGLYYGQPSFIDVGSNGYPESFGFKTEEAMNNGVWVKATSTNCLYYKALCIMADVADKLGYGDEKSEWENRAVNLKEAIKKGLAFSDGKYAYFKHKNGKLEERREVLGTAFLVLCDVLEGEDAEKAVADYPVTAYGVPLIYPYFENDRVLHNNSMWPFADTFFILAMEKVYKKDFTYINMHILMNDAVEGHMGEFRNTINNEMEGATAQLWSSAAYINTCVRAGHTCIMPEKVKIY